MPKKNIPSLKRLRTRFLRMRHPKHFDMRVWATKNDCGTAFCIAGHALDLQGYKTRPKRYDSLVGNLEFLSPRGRRVNPLKAATREMGLGADDAEMLFSDYAIKTPKQAAARIEALISDNATAR